MEAGNPTDVTEGGRPLFLPGKLHPWPMASRKRRRWGTGVRRSQWLSDKTTALDKAPPTFLGANSKTDRLGETREGGFAAGNADCRGGRRARGSGV